MIQAAGGEWLVGWRVPGMPSPGVKLLNREAGESNLVSFSERFCRGEIRSKFVIETDPGFTNPSYPHVTGEAKDDE
jgi:hypothetical protein